MNRITYLIRPNAEYMISEDTNPSIEVNGPLEFGSFTETAVHKMSENGYVEAAEPEGLIVNISNEALIPLKECPKDNELFKVGDLVYITPRSLTASYMGVVKHSRFGPNEELLRVTDISRTPSGRLVTYKVKIGNKHYSMLNDDLMSPITDTRSYYLKNRDTVILPDVVDLNSEFIYESGFLTNGEIWLFYETHKHLFI